jgi:sulfite dehydrogenase (cytochrome) subunit B
MNRITHAVTTLAVITLPMAVAAAPVSYTLPDETATFMPGPGVEVAQANCMTCHSTDYINYQPPKKGDKFWTAEVTKMIKVYGAPISEADAQTIAAYLAATY